MLIIVPGHPHYKTTLAQAPRWFRAIASTKADPGFCVQGANGLFRPMNRKEFLEWAHGGEFEEEFGAIDTDYELDSTGELDPDPPG